MGVDDTRERHTSPLPPSPLDQKVHVSGKEQATKFTGALEQCRITPGCGSIFMSRIDIHAAQPQTHRDGPGHVLVHIERDRQELRGIAPRSKAREERCRCCLLLELLREL
jgi:hypothetical protein